jgi:hypothetical protein
MASGDVKERAMKQYLVAGLAAALITGGLVGSAPPASAGLVRLAQRHRLGVGRAPGS